MSPDPFFNNAREIHDKVYPPPSTDETSAGNLAVAAAFEGMHHWEHDQRQKGLPMDHDAAKTMLAGVVSNEAKRVYDASPLGGFDDSDARNDMTSFAVDQAWRLYQEQYGDRVMYDPRHVDAHYTMAGEWFGWGGEESEI